MKIRLRRKVLLPLFSTLFLLIITCSVSNAQENKTSNENKFYINAIVEQTATIIGIVGGLFGMYKYFSNQREKEIREWQKVIVYKIFREQERSEETNLLNFETILVKYQNAGLVTSKFNLNKKDINEDTLRRILLELTSSGILVQVLPDSFKLNVIEPSIDIDEKYDLINVRIGELIGPNPGVFTKEEVAARIAPEFGEPIPLFISNLITMVESGFLEMNQDNRLSFRNEVLKK